MNDTHDPDYVRPAKHERQPHESYDDFSRRTRKGQWFKATFAFIAAHIIFTILVGSTILLIYTRTPFAERAILAYAALGWIPFLKLHPFLMRKLD